MTSPYIVPITNIHSTFSEVKSFFDKSEDVFHFEDKELIDISALTQGKRNLVVGEPGIGKTTLLQKMQEHLNGRGITTNLIKLRQPNAIAQIHEFLKLKGEGSKSLFLDGLDEVKSSLFAEVIQTIEEISKLSDLQIFISSRWVFIGRYTNSFFDYRFITISPFTYSQVKDYLLASGNSQADVDELLNRIMSFSHRMLILQIPRYLFFLEDFLKKKGVEAAVHVSRNELFEYFIYSKLELEEEKLNADKCAITKRVLEKLALVMEIYQTNVITKDELITFFDDLKSDLNRVALAQISIEVFYKYSLLKVSHGDVDKVEFENTEFQEYLAAKEITRFPEPIFTTFAFSVASDANEIYPTWYNALTFLLDMLPELLDQLIDFSGLRAKKFRVLDRTFLNFLSRINPRKLDRKLRHQLLRDVLDYHERTRQWLPGKLAAALPGLFDTSHETYLKERVTHAETEKESKYFVPLGNTAYTIGHLLSAKTQLDLEFWRSKLLSYAADNNQNEVLRRHALFALQYFEDPTIIDELPDLTESEELISNEFLSMCAELAPDHPKSLEYFFKSVSHRELHGRYGLYSIKKTESIKVFLKRFINDESFRVGFFENSSIFRDRDHLLVEKIEEAYDDEIQGLAQNIIVQSIHPETVHHIDNSSFLVRLWKLLRKYDNNLIQNIIGMIQKSPNERALLHFAQSFFAEVIEKKDVETYINEFLKTGTASYAHGAMLAIKHSKRKDAEDIYESGRTFLQEEYRMWEEGRASQSQQNNRDQKLLDTFRELLEPEPGKFSPEVFKYYNKQIKELAPIITTKDTERLSELLSGTIFKLFDPGKIGLTITQENAGSKSFTTSSTVFMFGQAILTAKHIHFDITQYRQKILNYIPFAHHEELTGIFELIPNIKPEEIIPIIEVYKSRHTDLWRHNPSSFVQTVQQYHVIDAAPILKTLVLEPAWEKHVRIDALSIIDSIAPDIEFLRKIFTKFIISKDESEIKLAEKANGLLISNHFDAPSIRWRLEQIVIRAAAYKSLNAGAHFINELEDEISFGKKFAKPLMNLNKHGYEDDYLKLLNATMEIWARGDDFHEYAIYAWEIVYSYFDNLKETRSYIPLQKLEQQVSSMEDREGANWLAGRMTKLRQSYLMELGKMDNISKAITKYNSYRDYDANQIRKSSDLFHHVNHALDVDLRRWIESEGAYNILKYKISKGRQEYEKLIQKTLKGQIELILLKRGFQVDVLREADLLDDKRTDFLVRYGFTGPMVIEVKLTSNKDIQGTKVEKSSSYSSMEQYMRGYGAEYGIFLMIDNIQAKNIPHIKETFQKIQGVGVLSFDCFKNNSSSKKHKRKENGKTLTKPTLAKIKK